MKTFHKIFSLIMLGFSFFVWSCQQVDHSKDSIETKINLLLAQMTLEEKLGQMTQIDPGLAGGEEQLKQAVREGKFGSLLNLVGAEKVNAMQKIAMEESRLKIPLLIGRDVIHGYKTIFPIPLGMASSWNPEIVEQAYRISSEEASAQGIRWTFAPMIDITMDPRWGRIAESCGEDPILCSAMATAMVHGIQGEKLDDPTALAACAKHFVGYGFVEGGREYNTTYITEPMLRDVVLKPFKAAKDAGVLTFMSAFNDLNGVPATGNEFTLRKVLRNEWKFDGLVVSDWTSVIEMVTHGYCANEAEAAEKAIKAGVDIEMSSKSIYNHGKELIDHKIIDVQLVDEAVRNILRVKFKLGLFENPYTDVMAEQNLPIPEYLEHARKVARQSVVLLKNDHNTLPLSPGISSVAVIGPLADSPRDQIGTWSFDADLGRLITPLAALKEALGEKKVNFVKALNFSRDHSKDKFAEAIQSAKKSEAILFFAGEESFLSGEGRCRGEINYRAPRKN
jgi:beta-glucosidase